MCRKALWVVFVLVTAFSVSYAQDDSTPPPDNSGITIHVVQRNETLFQIAQTYGTTVDSLVTLNSLTDPDNIQVGQRVIIPSVRGATPGLVETHIVEPGETLQTIAIRYNSTPESLSRVNNIFSPGSLYVGQSILVTKGANGLLPTDQTSMHRVQAGDNLMRLAVQYHVPLLKLARFNQLDPFSPLQIGQMLVIPDSDAGERFVTLPAPMLDFQIAPLPAEQGRTISAYIQTSEQVTITARIFDREFRFAPHESAYYAMIGVHSFAEPGIYPFTVTVTDAAGQPTVVYESRIRVVDGGYGRESIDIAPELQNLLDPAVVQAELDRVSAVMSAYTDQKLFDGLMNLPSTGPVTSQFGTRRSYNGSAYNTFHGGADFGGAPGSLIVAPADGVVVLAEPLQVRGNAVILDHGWGVYTGYWHQSEIFVQVGQLVKRGDALGTLGATGLVTGAHLHWEMWVGGVQVDALQWLSHPFDAFNVIPEVEELAP